MVQKGWKCIFNFSSSLIVIDVRPYEKLGEIFPLFHMARGLMGSQSSSGASVFILSGEFFKVVS